MSSRCNRTRFRFLIDDDLGFSAAMSLPPQVHLFARKVLKLVNGRTGRRMLGRRPPFNERFPVGRHTYGEPKVHWEGHARLRIGSFCSISDGVTILLGGNHRVDWITTYPFPSFWPCASEIPGHPHSKGDVIIGNDVWIGLGATILSGVTIGNGAVVGAYSVVTKNVPAYAIVAGNPAKLIRRRFDDEEIRILEELAWWGWPDDLIAEAMPLLLSGEIMRLKNWNRAPQR